MARPYHDRRDTARQGRRSRVRALVAAGALGLLAAGGCGGGDGPTTEPLNDVLAMVLRKGLPDYVPHAALRRIALDERPANPARLMELLGAELSSDDWGEVGVSVGEARIALRLREREQGLEPSGSRDPFHGLPDDYYMLVDAQSEWRVPAWAAWVSYSGADSPGEAYGEISVVSFDYTVYGRDAPRPLPPVEEMDLPRFCIFYLGPDDTILGVLIPKEWE